MFMSDPTGAESTNVPTIQTRERMYMSYQICSVEYKCSIEMRAGLGWLDENTVQ